MFRAREKTDSRFCEDPRHNKITARGNGGRRGFGVITTNTDEYVVCKTCYDRIAKFEQYETKEFINCTSATERTQNKE